MVFSRSQLADAAQREAAQEHLNRALAACKCSRTFRPGELLTKPWDEWGSEDFAAIDRCGCRQASCEKLHFDAHDAFTSAYFLELGLPRAQLEKNIPSLFTDPACGNVLRVKGFVEDDLQRLADWSKEEKVVAIGEIGLDYYYDLSPRETQMTVCEAQMELAWELSLPVAYHIRDAHQDMLDIMKRHKKHLTGGIIHCFSGSWEIAKEYLKLGYFISFAGPVTFKKAPKLQEAAVNVPLDRILIETDSPYLSPEPVRGRRNEPTNVRYVAEKIAALREMPLEAFAQITMQNALNAYSIKE